VSPRLTRVLGVARQVGLTVGAVVGALCIVVTLAALVLDVRPLVFLSGSMSPTIETGAVAIAHRVDASSLEAGQVVSVPTASGERVTHRIQSVEHQGDQAVLVLKGDANEAADAAPYVVDHADRVLFDVPWLGYVVEWLTAPVGLFFLGLYAAFLLAVIVRPRGGVRPRGKHAVVPVAALVLLTGASLGSGAVLEGRTTPTLASWTDPGSVSGTALTAYTVPAPDNNTCTVTGNSTTRAIVLTWPTNVAPLPSLGYHRTVAGLASQTSTLTQSGGTATLTVTFNPGGTGNTNRTATVTATGYPTASTSWSGPTATWKFRTGNNKNSVPVCGEGNPPEGAILAPDATTRTRAGEQTYLASAAACAAADVILCGPVSDDTTVTVDYILQRTVGTTVRCWTGSWSTTCNTYQAATTTVTNGESVFYESATASTVYGTAGTYTLTVRFTDAWANVTTDTVTFTLT
jgi:signal peptidase I